MLVVVKCNIILNIRLFYKIKIYIIKNFKKKYYYII